jgi:uracil permease
VPRTSIFVAELSGAGINICSVQLKGMALSAVVGIVLSLVFWVFRKFWLMNEKD